MRELPDTDYSAKGDNESRVAGTSNGHSRENHSAMQGSVGGRLESGWVPSSSNGLEVRPPWKRSNVERFCWSCLY